MTSSLAGLRVLLEDATPRPWAISDDALVTQNPDELDMERELIADLRYFTIPRWKANAALICALVNNAEQLIGAAERVGELEAALRSASTL